MDEQKLIELYYDFLIDMIDVDGKSVIYETLLKYLFDKDFVWLENIPLDQNRYEDGISLRKDFAKKIGVNEPELAMIFTQIFAEKSCSILEMFVAFAKRLTTIISSLENYDFFWMFIDNLGLNWATENDYDFDIVNGTIDDFLYGTFNGIWVEDECGNMKRISQGIGNPPVLFPCREVYLNLDKDLYMQANLYLKSYLL